MPKKNRRLKIDKDDYHRVVVTETLPYETPIIFSNDGLHDCLTHLKGLDATLREILTHLVAGEGGGKFHSGIPYLYKIRKDSREFRRLGLMHHRSQWMVMNFYKKYQHTILYHCSHSPASIRAPKKIAGSFFIKSSLENLNQYKDTSHIETSLEELSKHLPSFYSYRGYNRLYKFFESHDYLELEKRFSVMRTLDVSKCFDSIYTHTLSWAVKDKEFTKAHVSVTATFAQEFDGVMQHANHKETNGILIGPEISRLFSEILFQEIDTKVISRLADGTFHKITMKFGEDYSFRRYVDDVFIFATSEVDAQRVYECYADALVGFNLHSNTAKSILIKRPFVTNKSRLIHSAKVEINQFIDKFLKAEKSDLNVLKPLQVQSVWRLAKSFIDSIKTTCSHNQVGYDEVSPFLVSALSERIKKLVSIQTSINEEEQKQYRDALIVLLEILFFLYETSPSVGASYKLSTALILSIRFCRKHAQSVESTITYKIYSLVESLLNGRSEDATRPFVEGWIPLEFINITLSARELGDVYLLPETTIEKLFLGTSTPSYFEIVSCLFYIRNESKFNDLKLKVISAIDEKFSDLSDIRMNSEKAHLFFDIMCCPYLPDAKKRTWIREAIKSIGLPNPSSAALTNLLSSTPTINIHVDWKSDVDLLRSLEKKELKQAY